MRLRPLRAAGSNAGCECSAAALCPPPASGADGPPPLSCLWRRLLLLDPQNAEHHVDVHAHAYVGCVLQGGLGAQAEQLWRCAMLSLLSDRKLMLLASLEEQRQRTLQALHASHLENRWHRQYLGGLFRAKQLLLLWCGRTLRRVWLA